jgi:hypothetical protein
MAIDAATGSVLGNLVWTTLKMFAYIGMIIGIIVLGYLMYRRSLFKYTVVIFSKREGGKSQVRWDKGAFLKIKGGVWVFRLRKDKINIKPPENKYMHPFGKGTLILYRHFGADVYEPWNPNFDEKKEDEYLTTLDYDESIAWNISTKDLVYKSLNLKDLWEKYGVLLTAMLCLVLTIVAIYLVLQFAKDTIPPLTGALQETSNWIRGLVGQMPGGSTTAVAPQ